MGHRRIPDRGMDKERLFKMLESYRGGDVDWHSGKVFGYVYDAGPEVERVCKEAYTMFLSENGLDPTVYPSQLFLENDVVAMAASHLKGGEKAVGSFTSGGTESIILAVKCARDYARATRPEVKEPEMVLPTTAHAAFHKAAALLGMKPVMVPVDTVSFKASPAAMEKAITDSAILLVGSAPSYAHGVVDPITELGAIAGRHNLLLHVDACIGGFLLPYFREAGVSVPDFDFRVPGVTSISMDFHKYAYTAKGASVVLYRDKELRKHQFFVCSTWPGYSVVNPTLQSSKTVGPLAATWAVLNFIGNDGYLAMARELAHAAHRLIDGIGRIDGLYVLGKPEMTLVAFGSDTVNVFCVADEMKLRGWYVQVQLAFSEGKENLHLTLAPSSVKMVDALLNDLAQCVKRAREVKSTGLSQMIRERFGALDPSRIDADLFRQVSAMAGIKDNRLPDRMAEVNEILNSLPSEMCDLVLIEFFNNLFVPTQDSVATASRR